MYKPTRLDLFAMAALQGMCSDPQYKHYSKHGELAKDAVMAAQSTIELLDRLQPEENDSQMEMLNSYQQLVHEKEMD